MAIYIVGIAIHFGQQIHEFCINLMLIQIIPQCTQFLLLLFASFIKFLQSLFLIIKLLRFF